MRRGRRGCAVPLHRQMKIGTLAGYYAGQMSIPKNLSSG
jgi:hypothetical protein